MDRLRPLIAVLDDEPMFCKALERLLKTYGFEVLTFGVGLDLLASFAVRPPDCLVMDLQMPGMNGFEMLEHFAIEQIRIPVIVVTGHDQPGNTERVRALGSEAYLLKPLDEAPLLEAIGKVIGIPQHQSGDGIHRV
jgi:CheY-like chemotaxis protein